MMNVTLIDSLGNDLSVVNAARVSFAKLATEFSERDEGLIRYLATHEHWTPFSQVQYQVRIKAPIFVARQWFKHMIGISRNEVSRRYVDEDPEIFHPDFWRNRAPNKKQGSLETQVDKNDTVSYIYSDAVRHAYDAYKAMLDNNVCPEQARMILPQSMFTEWVETGSLAAAARIYKQRIDPHAQKEIADLAKLFGAAVSDLAPTSWKYLTQ